jgi:hypothetical protein
MFGLGEVLCRILITFEICTLALGIEKGQNKDHCHDWQGGSYRP